MIVPAYLDGLGHSQHGMVSHLNAHMGMSPSRDPHMHHGLTQSLQEEEEQYDDDGPEHDGEEGRDASVQGEIVDSSNLFHSLYCDEVVHSSLLLCASVHSGIPNI